MKVEIKHRNDNSIILFTGDFTTFAAAVTAAVRAGADLRSANLSYADLRSANLRSADLSYANLSYADLRSANLRSADLSSADLRSADLSYADLSSANLRSADLSSAKNSELAIAMTRHLPEGSIIGWKKCWDSARENQILVRLEIPSKAKRSHAFGRKCRASFAKVIGIFTADGKKTRIKTAHSDWSPDFIYTVGKTVRPIHPFDENWQDECSSGIHFFITREEAAAYSL